MKNKIIGLSLLFILYFIVKYIIHQNSQSHINLLFDGIFVCLPIVLFVYSLNKKYLK